MSELSARRWLVSGRVQGVFYRASCRTEALRLGLDGSARNLADGRVEVIAAGAPAALDALAGWLWRGPPLARVSTVETFEFQAPVALEFSTG